MQSSPSAGSGAQADDSASRLTGLTLGTALVGFLILLAVIGGSADELPGASQLRRGPASVVLSVLITLAGLAGVASFVLLIWGLVTRKRRSLDGAAPKRRSPILVSGVMLAILVGFTALLALAARRRHLQSFLGAGGKPISAHGATATLPFNTAASVTTSGLVIGVIAVAVVAKVIRSMGWRRVLRRPRPSGGDPDAGDEPEQEGPGRPDLEALGRALGSLTVADPSVEPDPRRAVIACYLSMLEVAATHGPERRGSETPTEYLRRMLALTGAGAAAATSLTGLFERARYSERPVDEAMRSDAIAALGSLRHDLLAGAAP